MFHIHIHIYGYVYIYIYAHVSFAGICVEQYVMNHGKFHKSYQFAGDGMGVLPIGDLTKNT